MTYLTRRRGGAVPTNLSIPPGTVRERINIFSRNQKQPVPPRATNIISANTVAANAIREVNTVAVNTVRNTNDKVQTDAAFEKNFLDAIYNRDFIQRILEKKVINPDDKKQYKLDIMYKGVVESGGNYSKRRTYTFDVKRDFNKSGTKDATFTVLEIDRPYGGPTYIISYKIRPNIGNNDEWILLNTSNPKSFYKNVPTTPKPFSITNVSTWRPFGKRRSPIGSFQKGGKRRKTTHKRSKKGRTTRRK